MDAAMIDVEYQITVDSCQDHDVRHFREKCCWLFEAWHHWSILHEHLPVHWIESSSLA